MPAGIRYDVSCLEPNTHHFDISLTFDTKPGSDVELSMPAWTPGAYRIENFAGRVHGESFTDARGRELAWTKTDKSTWRVELPRGAKPGRVSARYKVFALDLGIHKSYLDDQRAVINGASVFMTVVGREREPLEVAFHVPPSWKRISTGLEPVRGKPGTFRAAHFDELIDCPLFMGNHEVHTFRVRGVPHHIVIDGRGNHDFDVLEKDVSKIVESAIDVFDDVPYKHYHFLCELTGERYGGLEHRNSTHMIFPRWTFQPRKDYLIALSLIAHEFFHTWNVKRLRPAGLGPFDYSREVYTSLLWFAEGFTSYYDLLLLRRSGVASPREYLDELGREIRRLQMSPGRLVHSLDDSSRDAWIKLYQPSPDSPNTTISYYNKGSLFGMALDLTIRDATKGKRSLDDVMRLLYRRFYKDDDRGFEAGDVEEAAAEVAGRKLTALFDHIVRSTDDVDWDRFLGLAGLEISSKAKSNDNPRPGETRYRSYLGLRLSGGKPAVISQVLSDGPSYDAGLIANDELIAMDGMRLDDSKLDKWLTWLPPGSKVKFVIARAGVLQEREVVLAPRPAYEYAIQPRARATAAQQAVCRGWLGEAWKAVDRPASGIDFRPTEKIY